MGAQVDVTQMLQAMHVDEPRSTSRLWNNVYTELHGMASRYLRREHDPRSLDADGLVHEAYLRMFEGSKIVWQNRAHFFGIAARVMRRIIVDNARMRRAQKRGGGQRDVSFDETMFFGSQSDVQQALELDEMLARLEKLNERWSKVVELRYYAGLTMEEVATSLGVSVRTVERDWARARAWLYKQMTIDEEVQA